MQAAPIVSAPRLININRKGSSASSGSVQVDQEISVVSRTRSFHETGQRNPVFATTSSVSNGFRKSRSGNVGAETSESRMGTSHGTDSHEFGEVDQLRDNRESMKALSDFLRTSVSSPPLALISSLGLSLI
jgi:hypothetical protein